jgi:hypothetical protein
MKKIIIILMVIMGSSLCAQVNTLPFNGNFLTTDQFGFYYEVKNTEINKYSKTGKLDCSYSNNILGVIASVDVSNPQKILVYFKDFTKVLILDNTLSPTSEIIDLTRLELDETSLVCRSYNDGVWYYDPVRFELIRKDQELETTNTSGNLANALMINIQGNYLEEYNNRLYLNDPKNGVLVFDNFGTYLKTIPLYGLLTFQVKDQFLIYANAKGEIELYNFFTLEKTTFKSSKYSAVESVRLEGNTIFIQNKKNQLVIDKIEQ